MIVGKDDWKRKMINGVSGEDGKRKRMNNNWL